MTVKETPIERDLRDRCRKAGMLCLKFVSPNRRGVPDRIIMARAGTVFVETKRPNKGLRADQREMHVKMSAAGAVVTTLSSFEAVRSFVSRLAVLPPSTGPELVEALEISAPR